MSALTISIVQDALDWHDAAANRERFSTAISSIESPTDLIVLPEMFTSGFTMDAATNAEKMNGPSVKWMGKMAQTASASVCGSIIVEEDGYYFNRFVCVSPNGDETYYDKRHLFRLANEQRHYSAGTDRVTFEINGFRICPMICYDLRFPVWSRQLGDYDLLLYVANWPSRRQYAWDTLLRARAIENQCYAVGVNRVGSDGNDVPYTGGSSIVDFLGVELANLGDQPGIATATLDMPSLTEFREKFAFYKDADAFSLG